jgi:rhamnosyltransferase
MDQQHVFIVGAKSIGAYGGYETFVDKLTEYHQYENCIKYHIACKANGDGCMDESELENITHLSDKEFIYHNARCFKIHVPNMGPAQAIYYDVAALNECCMYIKRNNIQRPIVYILACRIGPFSPYFYKKIHELGGRVFINPDGHEWKRAKWNKWIKMYWKWSEQIMVKNSDLVICDSKNIENYIHQSYDGKGHRHQNPKTTYIAYGAEMRKSLLSDDDPRLMEWYKKYGLSKDNYYLIVGRFVPENNYETMIKEFMASNTAKDLAIITNINKNFLAKLETALHFSSDKRIKFVGTVYDKELLMKIRENAFAYLHGHEVGGTNPSLLEALGSTKVSLLLDVGFNREVAEDAALYWTKENGDLVELINQADQLSQETIDLLSKKAKKQISESYSWTFICNKYKSVLTNI